MAAGGGGGGGGGEKIVCVNYMRTNDLSGRKDALNIFYLRLYGIGHNMVKDHSAREETRCRHYIAYSLIIAAIYIFLWTIPQTR